MKSVTIILIIILVLGILVLVIIPMGKQVKRWYQLWNNPAPIY
jgi:Na+-transporting methylmalonyl-CoA/oxaloacetate decarboxylase gamma subunit